jgi:hypothetical protein
MPADGREEKIVGTVDDIAADLLRDHPLPIAQVLYLYDGRFFSESLVAPGRIILLSRTSIVLQGTTTYFVSIPRKPPTDSTA